MPQYNTVEHKVQGPSGEKITLPLIHWTGLQELSELLGDEGILMLLNKALKPAYAKILREAAKKGIDDKPLLLAQQLAWIPPKPKAKKPKPVKGEKRWQELNQFHTEAIADD
jgi:hypothetical protein